MDSKIEPVAWTREGIAAAIRKGLTDRLDNATLATSYDKDILLAGCKHALGTRGYIDPDEAARNLALFAADEVLKLAAAALLAAEQRGREAERGEAMTVPPPNWELDLLLQDVEARWPGSNWIMAKGRLSPSEPLYGFQVLQGSDVVLADGEGNTRELAVAAAIRKGEGT